MFLKPEQHILKEEILTKKNSRKYVLFPITYPTIYDMYKKQQQAFWTAEEIDFSADINDYNRLNSNEKLFFYKWEVFLLLWVRRSTWSIYMLFKCLTIF